MSDKRPTSEDVPLKDRMSYWQHLRKFISKLPREERKEYTQFKKSTHKKSSSKFI